jgi:predicted ATPase/DNA-binding SARP family transcriptional activator
LAHLSHTFLGPWQVLMEDGAAPRFKYEKVRALLTYLVVESGRAHRREALMDMFWPDLPETAARNNLRQALASLKEALSDSQADPPFLLVTRTTVQFNPGSSYTIDLDEFTRLLEGVQGHAHRRLASCRRCFRDLQQAAALYRGPFLSDFYLADSTAFEEWAAGKRAWYHQQAMRLFDQIAAGSERRGAYSQALQAARRQLELDPWREEAHRQAMRLNLLAGDRQSALAQYEQCRRLLAEELGVEPEPDTNALYEQIRSSQLPPSSGSPAAYPHNLPALATPFIGRHAELAEIGALLDEASCRLLTLTGPGGSGKTRLALQAAADQLGAFTDGVFFVSLAPLHSAQMLPAAVATSLGIIPSPSTTPREQVLGHVRQKEMLLVLDSFEHLVDAAGYVAELLRQAPELTILVSSRERLNIQSEHVVPVSGLPVPPNDASFEIISQNPAVQLFMQSAQRVHRAFTLTSENSLHVAYICTLTAGMPLAIELAAAWVRALSCREIAEEIKNSIGFLQTTLLDIPERHRSLSAVFEHSWQLLTADEQIALSGLSVFHGGFSRRAAEAVAAATPALLAALVDKSLLHRRLTGRYTIHDMIRQYAQEKISAVALSDIHQRFTRYYASLAAEAAPHLVGSEQASWLERLREENDNIHFALHVSLEIGEIETAAQIASDVWRFWQTSGQISEGRAWLGRILCAVSSSSHPAAKPARAIKPELAANVYKAAGVMAWLQGDYPHSKTCFEAGLELFQQVGDQAGVATLYGNLGTLAIHTTDYQEAQGMLEQALHLRRKLGDRWSIASCLNNLGALAGRQGDIARAQACYEECLAIFRELSYPSGIAISLSNLGSSASDLGRCDQAYQLHMESLEIRRQLGDKSGVANSLSDLGSLAFQQGNLGQACLHYAESLSLLQELGDKEHILECLEGIAEVAAARGQYVLAAQIWGAAGAMREAMDSPLPQASLTKYREAVARARALAAPSIWDAAWEQGRKNSLEAAIAIALELARRWAVPTGSV